MTEPTTPMQTIQETITLLKQQIPDIDYNLINRRGWNLGWHQNIYTAEILEDAYYDLQAITLAIKILTHIQEKHQEKPPQ